MQGKYQRSTKFENVSRPISKLNSLAASIPLCKISHLSDLRLQKIKSGKQAATSLAGVNFEQMQYFGGS